MQSRRLQILQLGIRRNQYFVDGNHRTAILSIFELLADVDICCSADLVELYIIISNGGNGEFDQWDKRTAELVKLLKRTCNRKFVSDGYREAMAYNVKSLWKWEYTIRRSL